MHRVDQFRSLLQAVQAADHLAANGIMARVVGDREAFGGIGIVGRGMFDLMVLDRSQVAPARERLRDWHPVEESDVDWDDALPDLARLDPALAPGCPACGVTLPMRAELEACPACAEPVDVPELIASVHGPEALAPCYEGEPEPLDDRLLLSARLHCPRCHYSLEGLPLGGHCPECGHAYDKREIVRSMLG